jgi:hypothetical protein
VVIEAMNSLHPECSKKSIERVFKEITVKEKRGSDVKAVYYATEEIILEICDSDLRAELILLAE